ncbi:MAG: hypothetical protein HQM13_07960 [SAR324 cluster bacterium]|nr:hypothetical protein [SAR324 cluster bacterium]
MEAKRDSNEDFFLKDREVFCIDGQEKRQYPAEHCSFFFESEGPNMKKVILASMFLTIMGMRGIYGNPMVDGNNLYLSLLEVEKEMKGQKSKPVTLGMGLGYLMGSLDALTSEGALCPPSTVDKEVFIKIV